MTVSETSLVGRLESGPDTSHDYGLHLRKYQALCDEAAETIERLTRELAEWKQAASVEAGLRREFLGRALTAEAQRDGAADVVKAATTYFDRYVQDEAAERECCISDQHHSDAKELKAAIRAARLKPDQKEIHRTKPESTQNI